VRLAVISDTHLPRGSRALPPRCVAELAQADLILHAGDISTRAVLAEIEAIGPPVRAVRGNVDEPALDLPEAVNVRLPSGALIAMVHDAGPAKGRLDRMRARFPDSHAVVFGHSHIPLHEQHESGFQIFNPGSPTDRRRQPRHTIGLADVDAGTVSFRHVVVD
jgi:uncharacterized protein